MKDVLPENIPQSDSGYENHKNSRFPVFWQLGILGILLFGMFLSVFITWWQSVDKNDVWVEQTLTPQKNSILTTVELDLTDINLTAKQIFVYDLSSNRVLFQRQPDEAVPLASITKLMTTLVAHEILANDATTVVPTDASRQQSASGLRPGEELTIKALLDFAMIASANDAAYTLAATVGQTIANKPAEAVLVEMMNQRARDLQLPSLRFYNSTGLDISTSQAGGYGTARDITFLMAYLYREYPEILEASTELTTQIPNQAGGYHNAANTNRILADIPNIIGSKTGYTDLAGGNLTIIYDVGFNRPIIITVLGSTFFGRFDDVANIIKATANVIDNDV